MNTENLYINDEWFWLEAYWEIRYFLPYGEVVNRFKTKEEAEGWGLEKQ